MPCHEIESIVGLRGRRLEFDGLQLVCDTHVKIKFMFVKNVPSIRAQRILKRKSINI